MIRILPLIALLYTVSGLNVPFCPVLTNPSELPIEEFLIPTNPQVFDRPRRPYYRALPPGMAAHHVIPYTTLRDFYNAVVNSARTGSTNDLSSLGFFLERMVNIIYSHVSPETLNNNMLQNCIAFARALQYYRYSTSTVPARDFFDGWLHTISLFLWLPGNLFIGPNRRNDDPGSSFEVASAGVFDSQQYGRLVRLNELMTQYINHNPAASMAEIVRVLNEVADHAIIYNYDSNDWARDNLNRFGIRTTTPYPHDELRRRKRETLNEKMSVLQTLSEDNCRGVHKKQQFFSNDKTACKLLKTLLLLVPHRVELQIDPSSGELQSINIKDSQASWFHSKDGSTQDYYISGEVESVFYNVNNRRCYIAIDDKTQTLYRNKFHETEDTDICTTAAEAFIMKKSVISKARPDPVPNYANGLLDLNIEMLCRQGDKN